MKRSVALLLASLIFLSCCMLPAAAEAGDASEGIYLGNNDYYKVDKELKAEPNTMEAWVYIPNSYASKRVGEIISNYALYSSGIGFGIFSNRVPKILWKDSNGYLYDILFFDVTLPVEEWVHLAIVRDMEALEVRCYVNGELAGTLGFEETQDASTKAAYLEGTAVPGAVCKQNMIIGGDHRANNDQYFKGHIKSVALYSDMRTEKEIKSDMIAPAKDDLLLYYDFTDDSYSDIPEVMTDRSGNGCNAYHSTMWMDTIECDFDYAYSMAVLGDTQKVAQVYPENFPLIYDWILGNIEEKKIKCVIGLGDITNDSTDKEFTVVSENIFRMNGVVPYTLARGNHDTYSQYHKYFNVAEYTNQLDGRLGGRAENTYRELVVGDVQYLILTLDYVPNTAAVNWAKKVIEAHTDYNVILVTHAYYDRINTTITSERLSSTKGYDGDRLWDELVSQYENIVMVLSGHIGSDDIIVGQREGVHGNIVTEMLIDFQETDRVVSGSTGMVTMFYFSEDGNTLHVENYSTIQEKYFKSCNHFTLQLDTVTTQVSDNPFTYTRSYHDNFTDVTKDAWFYSFVENAYRLDLLSGTSATKFSPDSTFTVAQALTVAAKIHTKYYGKTVRAAVSGEAWYVPYVEYCVENGIIRDGQFTNYDAEITRGDMAIVFANILPDSEYAAVRNGSPIDIAERADCYAAVKKLYEAGIVSGKDAAGNYFPNDSIKRSEACVIFTRIALSDNRAEA